jgi:hypothetical protein
MKVIKMIVAASLCVGTLGVSVPAAAERHQGWHNDRHHKKWHKRYRTCHMTWRHHHRVRVCSWHYR